MRGKMREFQPGLIYVFSYKKYKKDMLSMGCKPTGTWARSVNGMIVTVTTDVGGFCGRYGVNLDWCKCIGGKLDVK